MVISQWALHSIVNDNNTDTDQDRQFFLVVENPFNNAHTAAAGNSFVDTLYDMSWSGDTAAFNITSDHLMAQLDGRVSSGGQIYFTPMIDSTITFSARYDYDWPTSVIGQAGLFIQVADLTANENIYNDGREGGNVGLDPPHGTLTLPLATLNLFAGHDYKINYGALTDQYDASPPGTYGEGSGEIHFTIAPVPEPAALTLILPTLFLARRRKR